MLRLVRTLFRDNQMRGSFFTDGRQSQALIFQLWAKVIAKVLLCPVKSLPFPVASQLLLKLSNLFPKCLQATKGLRPLRQFPLPSPSPTLQDVCSPQNQSRAHYC